MTVGWVFLTVGVAVGVIWTAQARQVAPDDPNLQAMSLDDPKIFFALLTWAVYSFALVSRTHARVDRAAARRGCRRWASWSCSSTSCRSATS